MFYLQPSFASDGITTIKCQGCFPKLQDQDEWLEVDELGRNLSPFLLKALGPLSLSPFDVCLLNDLCLSCISYDTI